MSPPLGKDEAAPTSHQGSLHVVDDLLVAVRVVDQGSMDRLDRAGPGQVVVGDVAEVGGFDQQLAAPSRVSRPWFLIW